MYENNQNPSEPDYDSTPGSSSISTSDFKHTGFGESSGSIDDEPVITQLIAFIGDEDTCVGLLLAGIGNEDEDIGPNYIIVNNHMDEWELEQNLLKLLNRKDVALVLITKEAADKIPRVVNTYKAKCPVLMVIPGHNGPYEMEMPMAVKRLEEQKQAAADSRRSSLVSTTSLHLVNKSAHSIKTINSTKHEDDEE